MHAGCALDTRLHMGNPMPHTIHKPLQHHHHESDCGNRFHTLVVPARCSRRPAPLCISSMCQHVPHHRGYPQRGNSYLFIDTRSDLDHDLDCNVSNAIKRGAVGTDSSTCRCTDWVPAGQLSGADSLGCGT